MKNFWCNLGLHDWYKGSFSFPVWGRFERHCLCCDKKQYKIYKPKEKWITFILVLSLTFVSCKNKTELPAESISSQVDSASINMGENTDSICLH